MKRASHAQDQAAAAAAAAGMALLMLGLTPSYNATSSSPSPPNISMPTPHSPTELPFAKAISSASITARCTWTGVLFVPHCLRKVKPLTAHDIVPVRLPSFVTKNTRRIVTHSGHSMPFGFGRRGCPGASIGRGIVKTLVGAVVRNYRLSRAETSALRPLSFWRDGVSWWDERTGPWFWRNFGLQGLTSWLVDFKVELTRREEHTPL